MPHSRRNRVQKAKRQAAVPSTDVCKVCLDSESGAVDNFAKAPTEAFAKYGDQRVAELVTGGNDVLSSKKGSEFVSEYQRLPRFPTEGKLDISEIRCYGLKGAVTNEGVLNSPLVLYGEFNKACGEDYPLVEGASEYATNEYVTPVVISSIKKEYRTPSRFWFPLSDCCLAIEVREEEGDPVKFPFSVRYGGYEELMEKLFNYIGVSYLKRVPAQGRLYRVGDKDIDELGREYCERE